MNKEKGSKQELETPRTYRELINAIGADITPRIIDFCLVPSLREREGLIEAVDSALHTGKTLALIAEFVGYRHVELKKEEQGK